MVVQRNQVLLGIIAGVTPKLFMMDFQVRHRATPLISCMKMRKTPAQRVAR